MNIQNRRTENTISMCRVIPQLQRCTRNEPPETHMVPVRSYDFHSAAVSSPFAEPFNSVFTEHLLGKAPRVVERGLDVGRTKGSLQSSGT